MKSLSRVRLLATPWTAAYQAPPSMGFSKQEYWSGVPLPSLSISSSSEYSGLISLRIDRFDLLAVQGVAKSRTRLKRLSSSSSIYVEISSHCFNLHFPNDIWEKAMAPHSSTVCPENPMDGGAW